MSGETDPGAGAPAVLFAERGAGWRWVLLGPACAGAMLAVQDSHGAGLSLWIPLLMLVLVSGFVAIQVKAARVHVSVALTEQTLRQGTETIRLADIAGMYPEPDKPARRKEKPEKWQQTRALGELSGVPNRRIGIGLKLTDGRTVQAWAKDHRRLRAALSPLLTPLDEAGRPREDEAPA